MFKASRIYLLAFLIALIFVFVFQAQAKESGIPNLAEGNLSRVFPDCSPLLKRIPPNQNIDPRDNLGQVIFYDGIKKDQLLVTTGMLADELEACLIFLRYAPWANSGSHLNRNLVDLVYKEELYDNRFLPKNYFDARMLFPEYKVATQAINKMKTQIKASSSLVQLAWFADKINYASVTTKSVAVGGLYDPTQLKIYVDWLLLDKGSNSNRFNYLLNTVYENNLITEGLTNHPNTSSKLKEINASHPGLLRYIIGTDLFPNEKTKRLINQGVAGSYNDNWHQLRGHFDPSRFPSSEVIIPPPPKNSVRYREATSCLDLDADSVSFMLRDGPITVGKGFSKLFLLNRFLWANRYLTVTDRSIFLISPYHKNFSKYTAEALAQFQRDAGLPADGVLNVPTISALSVATNCQNETIFTPYQTPTNKSRFELASESEREIISRELEATGMVDEAGLQGEIKKYKEAIKLQQSTNDIEARNQALITIAKFWQKLAVVKKYTVSNNASASWCSNLTKKILSGEKNPRSVINTIGDIDSCKLIPLSTGPLGDYKCVSKSSKHGVYCYYSKAKDWEMLLDQHFSGNLAQISELMPFTSKVKNLSYLPGKNCKGEKVSVSTPGMLKPQSVLASNYVVSNTVLSGILGFSLPTTIDPMDSFALAELEFPTTVDPSTVYRSDYFMTIRLLNRLIDFLKFNQCIPKDYDWKNDVTKGFSVMKQGISNFQKANNLKEVNGLTDSETREKIDLMLGLPPLVGSELESQMGNTMDQQKFNFEIFYPNNGVIWYRNLFVSDRTINDAANKFTSKIKDNYVSLGLPLVWNSIGLSSTSSPISIFRQKVNNKGQVTQVEPMVAEGLLSSGEAYSRKGYYYYSWPDYRKIQISGPLAPITLSGGKFTPTPLVSWIYQAEKKENIDIIVYLKSINTDKEYFVDIVPINIVGFGVSKNDLKKAANGSIEEKGFYLDSRISSLKSIPDGQYVVKICAAGTFLCSEPDPAVLYQSYLSTKTEPVPVSDLNVPAFKTSANLELRATTTYQKINGKPAQDLLYPYKDTRTFDLARTSSTFAGREQIRANIFSRWFYYPIDTIYMSSPGSGNVLTFNSGYDDPTINDGAQLVYPPVESGRYRFKLYSIVRGQGIDGYVDNYLPRYENGEYLGDSFTNSDPVVSMLTMGFVPPYSAQVKHVMQSFVWSVSAASPVFEVRDYGTTTCQELLNYFNAVGDTGFSIGCNQNFDFDQSSYNDSLLPGQTDQSSSSENGLPQARTIFTRLFKVLGIVIEFFSNFLTR